MSDSFVTELSSYSYIDVLGQDASSFLQGQLTINTETPTDEKAHLAALCNPKGRIVSLFHIVKVKDGFRLIMPLGIVSKTQEHLKKYGVFFKVEISSPNLYRIFGLTKESMQPLSSMKDRGIELAFYSLEQDGLLFALCSRKDSTDSLDNGLNTCSLAHESNWSWQLATHRVSWLSADSVEHFLPHNLDLPALSAVDFNKGCFTGQEVIARMQYKGKLKQHLNLLKSAEVVPIEPKTKIVQGNKNVGEVICSVCIEGKGSLVLALTKDSANKQQNFTSSTENSPILDLVL